ncbi:MAG: hypothetical protein NTW40_13530 [Acidobacteria bacterium]|nr:hypothetical protein [Acidobacteriota bacterium]
MTLLIHLYPAVRALGLRQVLRMFLLVLAMLGTGLAQAQLPLQSVGSPFDMVGFLQSATLDPGDSLSGGTLKVNGHTVIVPRNTIMQMPAFALTWQQLFTMAPAPYGPFQTGLAMTDSPAPLTNYEVHVQGNRIGDRYIAGLIFISQHSLQSGQGFINFMDYANGELRVGGVMGDPTTGTRLKINDPSGRFAPAYTLDPRFTIDSENPTIRSETGYPMGFPHFDPAIQDDPLIPQTNRPLNPATGFPQTIFTMPPPGPGVTPNAFFAAPFMVGDYISYAGCVMKDGPQPSAGPMPAACLDAIYIAAHTITANLGIFTAPGTNPAYVAIDVILLGVGGAPINGIPQEATIRTRFEGFSTDASRVVDLFGIDTDACSTVTSDRSWGSIDVDPGPAGAGAVQGRWRFRPPSKVLALPPAGTFLPATREMRAVLRGAYAAAAPLMSGNGLVTGQYKAPIFDYLFPENLGIGNPPVPLNFIDFPFLVNGTGGFNGVNVGQLAPWPGSVVVAPVCGGPQPPPPPVAVPPIANSGLAQTTTSGALVALDGTGSSDPSALALTYAWSQTAGPAALLNSTAVASPTFTAPVLGTGVISAVLTFQLVVTNSAGTASTPASVNITVNAPAPVKLAPLANAGAAQTVASGATVQLNGTATTDPNTPPLAFTLNWVQTGFAGLPPVTLSNPAAATPTFKAPVVPPGGPVVLTFTLTATNTAAKSAVSSVNITVNPALAPVANAGTAQGVKVNAAVTLNGSLSTDPNGLPLTYTWVQVSGTHVVLTGANTAKPTFTAPAAPTSLGFTLTVSNGLLSSAAALVTVTVNPNVADTVNITIAEYRTGQQRLTVNATSSIVDGTPALTLMGYGVNGAGVPMTYQGNGLYIVVLTGVAQPATVTVNSTFGGTRTSALTKLRQ